MNDRVRLSKREFDAFSVHYPSNLVIIEMEADKEMLTDAGLKVNFNPDITYAVYDGTDTSAHAADVCAVTGKVVKCVEKIYFNRRDQKNTASWDTNMELKVGDIIWSHPLAMKNCPEIIVGNIVYKALSYEDIFCARRGGSDGEVICVNGNVILEEVYLPQLSNLDVLEKEPDKERGIVRYNGSNNVAYQSKGVSDIAGLEIGDRVAINKGCYPFYLERFKYNASFDDGKMYLVVQKRYISCVLSKNN